MSLNSLAARETVRSSPPPLKGLVQGPVAGAPPAPAADDRFEALTRYIPTETITLFVAAMSVQQMLHGLWSPLGPWALYWTFALLTPTIQLGLTWLKQREAEVAAGGPKAPFRPRPWPVIAALIAYLVWALSVPSLVPTDTPHGLAVHAVAAVGALFVSTVLSVGDKIANVA